MEGRAVLARENDGIIWIKTVHAPNLTPFVLMASLIHYQTTLTVIGVGLALVVVLLAIYLLMRRQQRQRQSPHQQLRA